MKRASVKIYGRVQGVWFRANTKEMAEKIGVVGWVCNMPDGSVEAVFEGEDEKVEKMIEWCRHGPPLARVDGIEVKYEKPKGEKSFRIIY
ncbi:MAG TPA: acylphosphatase [Thermoplasmatales archaeon]|nr:acylphosphatase [Thermoplasmatales archaeon]